MPVLNHSCSQSQHFVEPGLTSASLLHPRGRDQMSDIDGRTGESVLLGPNWGGPGCVHHCRHSKEPAARTQPGQAHGQGRTPHLPLCPALCSQGVKELLKTMSPASDTRQRSPAYADTPELGLEVSPSHRGQDAESRPVGCAAQRSEHKPANHFSCYFIRCHRTKHTAEITQQLCGRPSGPPITVT